MKRPSSFPSPFLFTLDHDQMLFAMAMKFETKLAITRLIFKEKLRDLCVNPGVLGNRLSNEVNVIHPRLTLVAMAMTFVEFGQKLIEV